MAIKNLNPKWMEQKKGQHPVTKIDWIARKTLDIPYALQSELQTLDIYLPDEPSDTYPVLVNIHGGGFIHCDKRDFHLYPTLYALSRGYAVVAVNYRLSPAVRYPQHIQDVLHALEWIGQKGSKYHLNASNVFLWGTSAGGNIVLQIACHQGLLPRHDTCTLRATAALCPCLNMEQLGETGTPFQRLTSYFLKRYMFKAIFGTLKPSDELMIQADIRCHLNGGISPVYLQHGTKDPAIPYRAAEEFAALLSPLLSREDFVFHTLKDVLHAGAGPDYFLPENISPILDFFDLHHKEDS